MENRDLNKELESKIPKITEYLKKGKEITMLLTPAGLKVKAADIKIIK